MKTLEEKRDKLAEKYSSLSGPEYTVFLMQMDFKNGWDACAKEYEKEIAELKRQSEIAKEALTFYASGWTMGFNKGELLVSVGTDLKFEEVHERARKALKALKDLESAGE